MSLPNCDLLVVGQGLAGSVLALQAVTRGLQVTITDPESAPGRTSSRVAAGLLTPLTGRKLAPAWGLSSFHESATTFYGRAAALLGRAHLHLIPIIRWFASADERDGFLRVHHTPAVRPWVADLLDDPAPGVHAPWGGVRQAGGAWLDLPAFLDDTRTFFVNRQAFLADRFAAPDVTWPGGAAEWRGLRPRWIVLCTGLGAMMDPWFPRLPFRPAGGTTLVAKSPPSCPGHAVWNLSGRWIAGRTDSSVRIGATYRFGTTAGAHPLPDETGELIHFARTLCPDLSFEVTEVLHGVRPILQQSRPAIGTHPSAPPGTALFNGLGSKGVLTAPGAASALLDHLFHQHPIPYDLDVCRLRCPPPLGN